MPLYAGMTVNERPSVSGRFAAWDEAVAKRDRAGMIEILMAMELTAEQAAFTTDTTLGNPPAVITRPSAQLRTGGG